jgi:integrase
MARRAKDKRPNGSGSIRKLAKAYSVRYRNPQTGKQETWPEKFLTEQDAQRWLYQFQEKVRAGRFADQRRGRASLSEFGREWIATRTKRRGNEPLAQRTKDGYLELLEKFVDKPITGGRADPEWRGTRTALGSKALVDITPTDIRVWNSALVERGTATYAAHAYSLVSAILSTAAAEGVIDQSPCMIKGAGTSTRKKEIAICQFGELQVILDKIPLKYRLFVLLALFTALRFGELAELRRDDFDLKKMEVRVHRAVSRSKKRGKQVKKPKSDAGMRTLSIPPFLATTITDHLEKFAQSDTKTDTGKVSGLVFPSRAGKHLASSTFYRHYYKARDAAGRPDLRLHDLRHTGLTLLAAAGATLAELMRFGGHSTPAMAMRYQHVLDREPELVAAVSTMAENNIVLLHSTEKSLLEEPLAA